MEREETNLVKLEVNYVEFGEKTYVANDGEEKKLKTVTLHLETPIAYTTQLGQEVERDMFKFYLSDILRFVHKHGGTDFLKSIGKNEWELERLLKKAVYVVDLQVGKWPLQDIIFNEQVMRLFKETEQNAEKAFEAIAKRPLEQ